MNRFIRGTGGGKVKENAKILGGAVVAEHIDFFFLSSACLGPPPATYGGSQARGLMGATAAGLHHSHSNARYEPRL